MASFLKKLFKYFTNPQYRFNTNFYRGYYNKWTDEKLLKKWFKLMLGYELNLNNPQTFNEKMQWLKLNNRKDIYITMVDKYLVKKYVSDIIGEEYVINTLGVFNSFDEINFDTLPNEFVIKCTHNSGGLIICKDKSKLDINDARKIFDKALKINYFYYGREWPYYNCKPRIIIEPLMKDFKYDYLPVYKFFCFKGEPKIIQVIKNDKQKNETIDYYDLEWNLLDLRQNYPNSTIKIEKPKELDKMIDIVKELAHNEIPFLRVDLYSINNRIYFSEFTFFSDSGIAKFYPEKWDLELGNWIDLSNIK